MAVEDFGRSADGRRVQAVTLRKGAISARILTWGAVLQGLWLEGVPHSLTLGSDRLADYEGAMRHHGSLVAPVANRFSGGRAPLDGRMLDFERNQDGRLSLHSGAAGTHLKVWNLAEAANDGAVLTLDLPDGEGGFPGNRRVMAEFALFEPAGLRLTITAVSDRPTLFNATNHSYWNLDGTPGWAGHRLRIAAARVLANDADFCPTGDVPAVAGTAFDFREGRTILPGNPALDNCFALADARRPVTPVLWLQGKSGVTMELATSEPGVQVYDGRGAIRPGRMPYEGLAIEAQGWPDAPNHAGFPPIRLGPGETCRQITEWRFSRA